MTSESGRDLVGQLTGIASDIYAAPSLDVAVDGVLTAAQMVELPLPTLVDNILFERRQDWVCAAFGVPPKLVDWWHAGKVGRVHRDVRHGLHERTPFRSTLLDGDEADLSALDRALRTMHHAFGIYSFIVVPVHLPDGGTSFMGWTSAVPGAAASRTADAAHLGLQAVSYAFVDVLERTQDSGEMPHGRRPGLSARERDCVRLVADGCTVKEVARSLSLSPFTVRDYLGNAMRRFEARNLPQLVSIAFRRGEIGFE